MSSVSDALLRVHSCEDPIALGDFAFAVKEFDEYLQLHGHIEIVRGSCLKLSGICTEIAMEVIGQPGEVFKKLKSLVSARFYVKITGPSLDSQVDMRLREWIITVPANTAANLEIRATLKPLSITIEKLVEYLNGTKEPLFLEPSRSIKFTDIEPAFLEAYLASKKSQRSSKIRLFEIMAKQVRYLQESGCYLDFISEPDRYVNIKINLEKRSLSIIPKKDSTLKFYINVRC